MTMETPVQGGAARSKRPLGFPSDSTVDVRQVDDQNWETLRALPYHATAEDSEVPVAERTDFASVPRVFVWFILEALASREFSSALRRPREAAGR